MHPLMTDHAIRREVLSVKQSFCISAPAGSGKTSLLTQRILALLARVERPDQILAITFTRKAAAEMRSRVIEMLEKASRRESADSEHETLSLQLAKEALQHAKSRGWTLNAEQLNIRTIDGLSAQLNRSMPVTSGLGGGAQITDDVSRLYKEAVDDLYELLGEDSERGLALRELLLLMENNWQRCSELLIALLSQRGDWLSALGQHEAPEAAAELALQTLKRIVSDRLAMAMSRLPEQWLRNVIDAATQAKKRLEFSIADGSVEAIQAKTYKCETLELNSHLSSLSDWKWLVTFVLTKQGTPRKSFDKNWGFRPKIDADVKRQLIDLMSDISDQEGCLDLLKEIAVLPALSLASEEWEGVLRLSRVLPVLAAQLLAVFQSRGMVDHTHMAMAADAALGDEGEPTDLAMRLDYQIQHILVDEFQDTSLTQFQLLEKLCRGWSEYNFVNPQAPRTLFIVGDGMQSIYGFRYADVGLFLKAQKEGIAGVALEARALTQNFRTQARVVNWVNRQFRALVPLSADPRLGVVPLTEAFAVHPAVQDQSVDVRIFPDDAHREAAFVADTIAKIQRHQPDARIAVLGRSRGAIAPSGQALARAGIDIVGSDLVPYSARPAVADLIALVRWLSNPADNIAFIALLRTPMVGLTLRDIGHVATLLRDTSVMELASALDSLDSIISKDGYPRLLHALNTLTWAESRRDRLDLTVWIEQTWLKLGATTAYQREALQDTSALFDQIRQQEISTNLLSVLPLLDWFERGFSKAESSTARVELMTLHKSKGLEFDHVFIVGAAKAGRSGDSPLLRWYRDGNKGLMIAAKPQSKTSESVYEYLTHLNKAQERQELIRLFYVGVTRAKLSCTITATQKSDKTWPPTKTNSFWSEFCKAAGEAVVYEPVIDTPSPEFVVPDTTIHTLKRVRSLPPKMEAITSMSEPTALGHDLAASNFSRRRYGVALHRGVELLSQYEFVPSSCPSEVLSAVKFQLLNGGSSAAELDQHLISIEQNLNQVLSDELGRWLLSSHHLDAHSELSLWDRETQREIIIDRTFIDSASGTRWIIDYKSSQPHEGEPLTSFLEREAEKYHSQLENYRRLVGLYDEGEGHVVKTAKTALYFPAMAIFADV